MPNRRSGYSVAFALGVAIYALAIAVGMAQTVRLDGWRPSLHLDFGLEIERLKQRGDHAGAARRLQAAAAIEFNREALLEELYLEARLADDEEGQIFALERLVVLHPRDLARLDALSRLLIRRANLKLQGSGRLDPTPLYEAIGYAGRMVEVEPASAWGHLHQAAGWLALGDVETAELEAREALRVDPQLDLARQLLAEIARRRGR